MFSFEILSCFSGGILGIKTLYPKLAKFLASKLTALCFSPSGDAPKKIIIVFFVFLLD